MNPAISSFVTPVAPQMPQAQAPASSSPTSSSQPGFSQMLSQAQSREAEAPAAEAAPEAAAAKPAHAHERAGKGDKAGKTDKTGKADKAADRPGKAEAESRTEKAEGDTSAADTAEAAPVADAPVADPALADWLAALQRPAAPQEAELGKAPGGDDAAAETALAQKGGRGTAAGAIGAAKDNKADAAEASREAKVAKGKPEAGLAESTGAAAFHAAMAQADESRSSELRPVHDTQPAYATVAAGVHTAQAASRTPEASAPVSVQVPTPATSPEFSQALGVQVSVLAKDGIQQAELHLNPAEMGPISVQIAIDGTQAQVNFGADVAATRQIIENGLPELAASLREAGFTLSGGGVHSQARGREQGEGEGRGGRGDGGTRVVGGSEADVTPRRVTTRVSAGGVDLYA